MTKAELEAKVAELEAARRRWVTLRDAIEAATRAYPPPGSTERVCGWRGAMAEVRAILQDAAPEMAQSWGRVQR